MESFVALDVFPSPHTALGSSRDDEECTRIFLASHYGYVGTSPCSDARLKLSELGALLPRCGMSHLNQDPS